MNKLRKQIEEAFGRVVYTYTAYFKMRDKNLFINKFIKIIQIVLTSLSASGFLALIITNKIALGWIAAITSFVSLFINIYVKDFKLLEDAEVYKKAADELWLVREKYISLLVDIEYLSEKEIMNRRDLLQIEVDSLNKRYPGTSPYGYRKAQKALKSQEEQHFSEKELDLLLPKELRKSK